MYLRCYWRYHGNSRSVILQIWCQIHRTSSSLLCVNCGPGQIQDIYSCAYFGINIQVKVAHLLLEVSRQINERYTANLMPYIAHILPFALCELWSRTYTMYLQLPIFRPQYSTECTCAAIGDIFTIKCSLYCTLGAKYSSHPPVYNM
jgi:hypothetical protein